jgi:hypothetical protein
MYIDLDWHSIGNLATGVFQDPMYDTSHQETYNFWRTMARHYAGHHTVAFFEFFNEPTTFNNQPTTGFLPVDDLHAVPVSEAAHDLHAQGVHPDPVESAQYWHDTHVHNPNAQFAGDGVFESITGRHLPEETVVNLARERGWFDDEAGTLPEGLAGTLNEVGVHAHQHYEAPVDEIVGALRRGDHVVVAVDANEVYRPIHDPGTGEPVEQANAPHTALVREIQPGADGSIKVVLSHPGSNETVVVDGEDFLNAWRDYGNLMVTTRNGDA